MSTQASAPASHPDWLPLHRDPRPGDWVIHYRLTPTGLSRLQRRTEVVARQGERILLRRTLGDDRGLAIQVLRLTVDRSGRVHQARLDDGRGAALPLIPGRRQQTRLDPVETLELVSGRHAISRIVVRRTAHDSTTVHYLSDDSPFAEVVSLTTRQRLTLGRLNKLLGRIAVPDPATARDRAPSAAVQDGWILMHWGRGSR